MSNRRLNTMDLHALVRRFRTKDSLKINFPTMLYSAKHRREDPHVYFDPSIA